MEFAFIYQDPAAVAEAAKEFGTGFYMFVSAVIFFTGLLLKALHTLYRDVKECHKELKEARLLNAQLSEETIGGMKDVSAVLTMIKDHNPQVIRQIEKTERNLAERIDKLS